MKDETEPLSRGELMTDEATPRRLVRVCTVVAQRIERGDPWKLAAVDVLQALARASWSDAFLPVPGLRARRVDESHLWRPAYPAGGDAYAALMKEWESALDVGILGTPPAFKLTADEAAARGMEHDARSLSFWDDQGGVSKEQAAALPALPALSGPAGLLQFLHEVCTHARKCTDLAAGLAGEVLMLESDAAALCGYEVAAERAMGLFDLHASARPMALAEGHSDAVGSSRSGILLKDSAGQPAEGVAFAAAARVMQPDGGAWPHAKDKPWTDSEREAAFRMRHQHSMTGRELEQVIGVSRQRIDQEIGKAKPDRGGQWLKGLAWQPSPALLAACGINMPRTPLQMVADAVG